MEYDIIIIGAGPAGLTAAIYAGRSKMKTLLISENIPGGQTMLTEEIENYPGFPEGINGPDLLAKMCEQVKKLEISLKENRVEKVARNAGNFLVTADGQAYEAKTVILAAGASYKKLGVKGEETLTGKGVSYCGVCDAPFFKDKEIAVVGGGDTALYEAGHLLKFCSKLHLIHRRDKLRATKIMQDRVLNNPKTIMHWDSVLEEISGAKTVEGIKIKNIKKNTLKEIPLKGVFIFVGISPESDLLKGLAEIDGAGYVITDENLMTSIPGLFACGDVRKKALRQVSTAVGEGALASFAAQMYTEKG